MKLTAVILLSEQKYRKENIMSEEMNTTETTETIWLKTGFVEGKSVADIS